MLRLFLWVKLASPEIYSKLLFRYYIILTNLIQKLDKEEGLYFLKVNSVPFLISFTHISLYLLINQNK
jgi:hypothetical protein